MKKIILFILTFVFCAITYAQQYKTHAVKQGETLESIAKEYKVTPHDIIKLNPEIKDGTIKLNTILIIPGDGATGVVSEEAVKQIQEGKDDQEKQPESFFKHKVRAKETIYGIAKMYNVSQDDIKRYNKELYSRELKKGEKIQIPKYPADLSQNNGIADKEAIIPAENPEQVSDSTLLVKDENVDAGNNQEKDISEPSNLLTGVIDTTKYKKELELLSFKTHKVKRKETLYSLSRQYNVSQDDIKRHNKELYARQLKKGEKIQIPVFKVNWVKKEIDPLEAEKDIHIVKPKDTRWGIANSYGLTIDQLKILNPGMGEIIKIGDSITIPKKENLINIAGSDNFVFYEVKPKETLYSLTRTFKISNDSLQMYNPTLKDGLKAGMILKLPKERARGFNVQNSLVYKKFSLLDSIKPMSTTKIAYILPFKLEAIDFESRRDVLRNVEKSKILNLALDFYTGALMALDSIKKLGVSVDTKIFDSEASEVIVTDLASINNNFRDYEAIIGPIMPNAFNRLSDELRRDSIPIFSPFSSNIKLDKNVFQTIPSDDVIRAKMISFIKENVGDRRLIIISDEENENVRLKLLSEFPQAKFLKPIENTFIRLDDINPLLSNEQENWVIVETNNIALLTNVSGVLNSSMIEEIKVTMLTTKRGSAYDSENVSNFHLSNLNFHFPTVDKVSSSNVEFNRRYRSKYKELPSRYATRGYDITMDVVLRLAYSKNLFNTARYIGETEYVENKFEYDSNSLGGYYNKGLYIAKYEDMEIVLVDAKLEKLVAEN